MAEFSEDHDDAKRRKKEEKTDGPFFLSFLSGKQKTCESGSSFQLIILLTATRHRPALQSLVLRLLPSQSFRSSGSSADCLLQPFVFRIIHRH